MAAKKMAPSKKGVQPLKATTRQRARSSFSAGSRGKETPQKGHTPKKGASGWQAPKPPLAAGVAGGSQRSPGDQNRATRAKVGFSQDLDAPVAGTSRDAAVLQGITQTLAQLTQQVEQLGVYPVETKCATTSGERHQRQRSPSGSRTSSDS